MSAISGKSKGYFALLVTSIVWGTTWVVSKIAIQHMPALQMVYIRQFLAGAGFVLFFMGVKKFKLPTRMQFGWLLVMAFLMFVFANGFSTWGVKYIPAGLGALIGALYPFSVVCIERIFLKKKNFTALTFLGLFLGLSGVAVVFYENAFMVSGPKFILGLALSVFAMLSWSLGTVFLSRNKANIDPYYGTGWQMLIASLLLFIMAETTTDTVPLKSIPLNTWMMILYLVVFGSVIAFIAFIYSMKKLPASIASLYAYMNPMVAMLLAAVLLKEKLTLNILWGSVVTLLGVFMVNYSVRKTMHKPIVESEI